jgi:DNA-binding transcriptional ArsR family regulator
MSYEEATARVLDALGDPTRRRVLEVLRGGAQPVHQIASQVPVSRPAVSQHLRVPRPGRARPTRGDRHLTAWTPPALHAPRVLETFWDTALAAFKETAEAPRTSETPPEGAKG